MSIDFQENGLAKSRIRSVDRFILIPIFDQEHLSMNFMRFFSFLCLSIDTDSFLAELSKIINPLLFKIIL